MSKVFKYMQHIKTKTIKIFLDEVWLQIYNKERKKENLGQVTGELFEAIIDQLEKEWFNLVRKKYPLYLN